MLSFRKVSKNNIWKIIKLDAADNEKFVSSNSNILIKAFMNNRIDNVKAIYNNSVLIGLFYYYPTNKKEDIIWFSNYMIDKNFQNKGFGTKSFEKAMDFLKKKYKPRLIELSTGNPIAANLYKKYGFVQLNNKRALNYYKKYNENVYQLKLLK